MAYSSFFAVLFLGLIFNYGCVSKDESKKEETVKESVVVDEVPVSNTPVVISPPVVTQPPVITPAPTPTTPPTTDLTDAQAGKVSLWKRSTSYDCAVFLPADYGTNSNKQYPLILSLHGLNGSVLNTAHTAVGGSKTGFIKQVWGTTLATKYPAVVIAPNWSPVGSNASGLWNHSQLRQIILEALKKYQVDPQRVVVTGLSAGSIATQELIKYSKDLIAGAMPGAYNSALLVSNPCQMADLPVWVFGNTSDSYFQSSGWTAIEPKVQSCDNYTHEFRLDVYQSNCGHGCWDTHWAKPEVQQWLMNQTK